MVTPKEKLIQLKRSEWRRKRDDARAVHRRIGGISYALRKVTRREQNVESHKISDFYHDLDGAFGGRRIHHLGNPMEAFNRGARHLERSLPCVLGRLPDNPEMIALSAIGTKRTIRPRPRLSAFGPKRTFWHVAKSE